MIQLDKIYIPIWLDLLYLVLLINHLSNYNLHSNMVRFIIRSSSRNTENIRIYIPIWLDLLCLRDFLKNPINYHLHSNMVRFIMFFAPKTVFVIKLFTFQYG